MLTQTLRLLERDGLVRREVFAAVPPHVEYSLTPLGRSLSSRIAGIREWAYANMDEIETARRNFDTSNRDAP
jgi:DNA-binding HxlR family transcriptional regulator